MDVLTNGTTNRAIFALREKFHPTSRGASVRIAGRPVGDEQPVFVVAEIGINHNGSLDIAKKLIAGAAKAGCDAVKFQKRTPELCVPREQWEVRRETPWGEMSYIEYRRRMEFTEDDFAEIDAYCRQKRILWFASCWDEPSVTFVERFNPPCYKAASASLTDHSLIRAMKATGKPLILSTGMSTAEDIDRAVHAVGKKDLLIAHATSTYPCPVQELNLRMIVTLRRTYECPIGYSGHETGLTPTWAAVSLGATFVERHITLDRAMWGSDHAASVELGGLTRLVAQIRDLEAAMGDGVKRVYESELPFMKKLRSVKSSGAGSASSA